ncbi:zinc metalloprotease HtpX [Candidatus Shapirobacteria bacterium]|nr:MAG: zinc metalloprotease HtpX [Candidatus Shapirobacteria bacterium]
MLNIYQQIQINKTKSNLVIALFIIFISLLGYSLVCFFDLDYISLFFIFFFSLASSISAYFYGDQLVLKINHAQPAQRQNYFDYYTSVENLSLVSQIPMPKIYVINSPASNAFATGRDPKHASICVTSGLLKQLNRSELEAVLAHELSHVKNYDIRLMTIVSILVALILNLTRHFPIRNQKRDKDNDSSSNLITLLSLIFILISPLIATLVKLAISRRREYLADASAVKLTRQPQALIDALTKIANNHKHFTQASTATASLYIHNPFNTSKFNSLFSTHPPIQKRIEALQKML